MSKTKYTLKLTDVTFFRGTKESSKVLSFATATFNSVLRVTGMRIVQGEKGRFVSYPSEKKSGTTQYYPICFLLDREVSDEIQAEILKRFDAFTKDQEEGNK